MLRPTFRPARSSSVEGGANGDGRPVPQVAERGAALEHGDPPSKDHGADALDGIERDVQVVEELALVQRPGEAQLDLPVGPVAADLGPRLGARHCPPGSIPQTDFRLIPALRSCQTYHA